MTPTRCGFVALVGLPNAGKSTLLNALVGSKVSIVSPKVQTTRARIMAVLTQGQAQAVLVDTPGLLSRPKRRLEKAMQLNLSAGLSEADASLLVVDAQRGTADLDPLVQRLARRPGPRFLLLNKTDLVTPTALLPLAKQLNAALAFDATFMASALKQRGIDKLRERLLAALPEGAWLFPKEQITTQPERFLAAEITREQLFLALHQELPYQLTVETDSFTESKKDILIHQTIYVARKGHKAIVIGAKGQTLKRVGQRARRTLEALYETQVRLYLFVKVRPDWLDDPSRYQAMGLEYSPDKG